MPDGDITLKDANNPTQVSGSQADVHTVEENNATKVGSEVDSVTTTVETKVQDTVMTAIEELVNP